MKRAEHECAAETASLDTWVATSSRDPFATHLPEGDCIAVCLTGAATAPAVYLTAGRAFLYCPEIHQTRCHASGSIAPVSYTHLRAHETDSYLVCRLLL